MLKSCEDALDDKYTVHRLYEHDDRAAFLSGISADIRVVAGGGVNIEMMDQLPNLQMVSNFGVGYDSIDTDEAKKRNIRVTNTPDVLNDAMAEITLGLMISVARSLPQAHNYVKAGKWPAAGFPLQNELTGKTVGILGLGRIGKEIADRCIAMKMRIVYYGRNQQLNLPYIYYDNLTEMARDADWLVVIAPGGAATSRIVNREVMEALGPNGTLVNVGRGTIVDEPAMIDLLKSGKLGAAGLDVFEHEPKVPAELLALDNVVFSPHQGSATHQTRYGMGALVVANIDAFFAGDPLLTPVV